jgi:hypothetical protein
MDSVQRCAKVCHVSKQANEGIKERKEGRKKPNPSEFMHVDTT